MDKKIRSNKKNIARILVIVLPIAAAIIFKIFYYRICALFPLVPECIFHRMGILCPGCGATRAFLALCWGKVLKSLMLNPAIFLGAVWFLLFYIEQIFRLFGKEVKIYPRNKRFYIVVVILLIIYYIVRNFSAFSFLTLPGI